MTWVPYQESTWEDTNSSELYIQALNKILRQRQMPSRRWPTENKLISFVGDSYFMTLLLGPFLSFFFSSFRFNFIFLNFVICFLPYSSFAHIWWLLLLFLRSWAGLSISICGFVPFLGLFSLCLLIYSHPDDLAFILSPHSIVCYIWLFSLRFLCDF